MSRSTKIVAAFAALLVGGIGVAAVAGQAARPEAAHAPHALDIEEANFDELLALRSLHERMVADRVGLHDVTVRDATVSGRDATLTLIPRTQVWAPAGVTAPKVVTLYAANLPPADAAYWSAARTPLTALASWSGSSLLAIAPTTGLGGELAEVPGTSGPLFLATAAGKISRGYRPVTRLDHCAQAASVAISGTPRTALVTYLRRVRVPENVLVAKQGRIDHLSQQLADRALGKADPVTGVVTGPDVNDVYRQLVAGVAADRVVYRRTVPVEVDLTGVAPSGQHDPARQAVVFVDTSTREVLGWVAAVGVWTTQGGSAPTPRFVVTAKVRPPATGAPVAVTLRDLHAKGFDCASTAVAPSYDVVVPFERFAGAERSRVVLASRTVRPFGG